MSLVNTKQFVVITDKNKVLSETLSPSRVRSLRRYKEKWLTNFNNPSTEWSRRRRKGFRVATVQVREVA